MNLASAFVESAERNLVKKALFWGEKEISYGAYLDEARLVAGRLGSEFGIEPGARVGIWLRNSPEYVSALYGIWLAGACAVPINNFLKAYEVDYIIRDSGIGVLLTNESMDEAYSELLQLQPGLKLFNLDELKGRGGVGGGSEPGLGRREGDLAVIIYTSGTTGRPKGAMLTHGNLLANVESCRQVLEAVSYDRFVILLPMFHSFMLTVGILLPLSVGGSIVLIKSLHPPKNILQEILAREATLLPAIPQFFRALASTPLPAKLPLRLCVSGAAPLPVEVLKEFSAKVPVPLLEGYGLSEASPVVSINPVRGRSKAGSIGVPIPGVEVTIQDEQGLILADGVVGELCVRGANVMAGYWNRPEETAQALRKGWLLTGDVGYRDGEGYFYITDRKKDMLLVNGMNVYPREIEEVMYQYAGVKEAAVIGVPDARKGEQPLAFVVVDEGVTLDEKELIQFVRHKLADYKVPRQVVFLSALPRNATGKILKTELRKMTEVVRG